MKAYPIKRMGSCDSGLNFASSPKKSLMTALYGLKRRVAIGFYIPSGHMYCTGSDAPPPDKMGLQAGFTSSGVKYTKVAVSPAIKPVSKTFFQFVSRYDFLILLIRPFMKLNPDPKKPAAAARIMKRGNS